ncbi:bile acid:sodium symporter family protein [Dactylosporangium sp. NPDC000521]|uniref:bile acid:sodium symporter family protein n=1 Tax=Dactylosporangium sp. NPDC000521 TaxID=3363975 RepID=UPI0036B2A8F2
MDLHQLLNAVTVIFIAGTMFGAGLGATVPALRATFSDVPLLLLVLLANLIVVPLLGWGMAALFSLAAAPFVALLLTASSPGGPFAAKLGEIQGGDVTAAAAMQVLLAAVGSITFGFTANALLRFAGVGSGAALDVGALVRSVALLQLVPFLIGLLLRRYATPTALAWHPVTVKVSNVTFLMVLAGMLLGNWTDVVALLGTRTLLAGFLFSAVSFALGTLLSTGLPRRRTTMGGVAAVRNIGPALAAVSLAFDNAPTVLGALAAVLLSGTAAALPIAAFLARHRTAAPSDTT